MSEPQIGDKLRFKPSAYFTSVAVFGGADLDIWVTGTVVYVNEAHRYYRCAYEKGAPGCIGHECFKF